MKIGIDISQIVYKGSGVARFTDGLTRAICQYDTSNEWHFFFYSLRNRVPPEVLSLITKRNFHVHERKIPPTILEPIRHHYLTHGFTIHLPGTFDWFITSDWTEPATPCKKATIVHDFAYKRFPETVASSIRRVQERRLQWVARESNVIFADSESTKKDALDYLKIDSSRIIVNYPGVELQSNDAILPPFLKGRKYILTVGKREPRKNLDRLITAFNKAPPNDTLLVVVGNKGWGHTLDSQATTDQVRFLGYVSDGELKLLYKNALAFVYPSVWEGFGYPVIEAMSLGVPVATSNTSSLGEIAAGHAVLFDPESIEEIAESIQQLSADDKLRKKLSGAGKKHAESFTWKKYYATMMEALK